MRAVIGIGSNLGDRLAALRFAVRALRRAERSEELGLRVLAVSRVYESTPVGGPPQPDFLNAAVCVETDMTPRLLLLMLLGFEQSYGRERRERWGPRTLDLDLLWIDGVVVDEPDLVVPHARLHERAFAMVPLLEVAPDARDPRTGAPLVAPTHAPEELRVFAEALDAPVDPTR